MRWLDRRRQRRLVAKLDRAFWRSTGLCLVALSRRDMKAAHPLGAVSEEMYQLVESINAGERVGASWNL